MLGDVLEAEGVDFVDNERQSARSVIGVRILGIYGAVVTFRYSKELLWTIVSFFRAWWEIPNKHMASHNFRD